MKNPQTLSLYTQFTELGGARIFLPNGETLLKSLVDKWREMHVEMKFGFLHTFQKVDQSQMHKTVFTKEKYPLPARLASLSPEGSDFASIFCKKNLLNEELISSLHFLEQTIKIFGFESNVYFGISSQSKEGIFLKEALEQKKIAARVDANLSNRVEFRLRSASGEEACGPFVQLESVSDEIFFISRSLFGSFEVWTELMVKANVNRSRKG